MRRNVPQIITLVAVLLGTGLFAVTLLMVDRESTMRTAARLGLSLPIVLLPGALWHLLRAVGWYVCFPEGMRPGFWRLFRVRLAADAVAYFTIRGLASEPLRVLLLLDRVPAAVSAAASILERTAMGILSVLLVGLVSVVAMSSDHISADWRRVFMALAVLAAILLAITFLLIARTGRYLGPLFATIHRWTGWRWTSSRAVQFVNEVEAISLNLARTERGRLRALTAIAVVCYALMMLEVWIVFRAILEPVTIVASAFVETFTRSASVLSGVIPANFGALEAANVAIAKAVGATGAGSLALARRVRGLLWAGLGLAMYPTLRPVHRSLPDEGGPKQEPPSR
jgi:hypothetical protein